MTHSLRRILCPVDIGRPSNAALGFATMLAGEFESVLDVMYAPEGHDPSANRWFAPRIHAVERMMSVHNLEGALQAFLEGARPVESTVEVRWGRPLRVILAEARRRESDLMVLGSHARVSSWPFATAIADALAVSSPCPILTVPETEPATALTRIVVPMDFSAASEMAVDWAAVLACRFDARVDVVFDARAGVPSRIADVRARFALSGIRPTLCPTRGVRALDQIALSSDVVPGDLVVVALDGRKRSDVSALEGLRGASRVPVFSIGERVERRVLPSLEPALRCDESFPTAVAAFA
jgi:nucleotide-binding universal stress UspA family protein